MGEGHMCCLSPLRPSGALVDGLWVVGCCGGVPGWRGAE
jgi:hypothetical protein